MTAGLVDPVSMSGVYTLISGVPVVARDDDTVQIGGEPPHWLLLHRPPTDAVHILRGLNGTSSLGAVLARHSAHEYQWRDILTVLLQTGLLVPAAQWAFPGVSPGPSDESERDSLVHRHGIPMAQRILRARRDAVVLIRGSGRVASAVATALATSGIGHVHQQPDRALRLADLTQVPAGGRPAGGTIDPPTKADAALLAADLRRAAPGVDVHPPAPHHRVALVVLAGDGTPAPSLGAELCAQRTAHLPVRAGLSRAQVGPLVLPGRSACLGCGLRARVEIDPGRQSAEEALRQILLVPPTQLVVAAAAIGVTQALAHLDGVSVPAAVDGSLEWQLGDLAPRRRSLIPHPECGCGAAAAAAGRDDPGEPS